MKKFLSILLILGLIFAVLMLTACDNGGLVEENGEEGQEIVEGDEEIDEEDDPIGDLRSEIDPKFSLIYLERDGNTYSLSDRLHDEPGVDYKSGVPAIQFGGPTDSRRLYEPYAKKIDGKQGCFSYGEVPRPVLQKGDRVVAHSRESIPTLALFKVEYTGCALPIFNFGEHEGVTFFSAEEVEYYSAQDIDDFKVVDSSGNVITDYYNVEEGEKYTLSWHEGTEYEEHTIIANSSFYTLLRDAENGLVEPDYRLEGEATKNGTEYDLSGVSSGIYIVSSDEFTDGGIIEIE